MICSPHVKTGLSDVIGSWKIIEISLPRIARISRGLAEQEFAPAEPHGAADDPSGRLRHEPEDRQRRDALAAARLADDRERLARVHLERHAVHGAHDRLVA